jgi:excisionase family DNA binding protein
MNNDSTELVTIDELCEMLGCGYNTAYKLLGERKIPSFRLGRTWKIPRGGVEQFISNQSGLGNYQTKRARL